MPQGRLRKATVIVFTFERLADFLGRLAVNIETVSLALKTVGRDRPRDWKCYRARD